MVPIASIVAEIISGIGVADLARKLLDRQHARLDVARVLASFEQQDIGAAVNQAARLLVIGIAQFVRTSCRR